MCTRITTRWRTWVDHDKFCPGRIFEHLCRFLREEAERKRHHKHHHDSYDDPDCE
jgi:hypothetical protein